MKLSRLSPLCFLIAIFAAGPLAAEPFWAMLMPIKKVEADPNKEYVMTKEHGPWMILATSFSGEGAEDQARDLVLELRSRYNLEAYTHEMTFDFTDGVIGRGVDATGQPVRMQYQKDEVIREIAVLVGNYPSVGDPEAQETLRKIKYMRPDALSPKERESTSQSLAALRMIQKALLPKGDDRKKKGPMGHALLTRNPLIPREYFAPRGIDEFIEKINSDVKYSLLDCAGQYSVKVATFTGKVVIDQQRIQALENGAPMKSRLDEAGEDAETLAIALRQKGYEAYVLHDRNLSMVTIGSFETIGSRREDGTIELLPQIHAIMKAFTATPRAVPGTRPNGPQTQTAYALKSLAGIPFDIQPQIVRVPRRSIGSDYSR
jgi:hypothetical protein